MHIVCVLQRISMTMAKSQPKVNKGAQKQQTNQFNIQQQIGHKCFEFDLLSGKEHRQGIT